jgi:hypothetical protein
MGSVGGLQAPRNAGRGIFPRLVPEATAGGPAGGATHAVLRPVDSLQFQPMLQLPSPVRTLARRLLPLIGLTLVATACGSDEALDVPSNPAVETYASALNVNISAMTKKSDALYIIDQPAGTGSEAIVGRKVRVAYSGYLINGSRFDSGAFTFTIGAGEVIPGWDQGVVGMKVGGKRKLVIGSALGYGKSGSGPIPPNATLVFDVELQAIL